MRTLSFITIPICLMLSPICWKQKYHRLQFLYDFWTHIQKENEGADSAIFFVNYKKTQKQSYMDF